MLELVYKLDLCSLIRFDFYSLCFVSDIAVCNVKLFDSVCTDIKLLKEYFAVLVCKCSFVNILSVCSRSVDMELDVFDYAVFRLFNDLYIA